MRLVGLVRGDEGRSLVTDSRRGIALGARTVCYLAAQIVDAYKVGSYYPMRWKRGMSNTRWGTGVLLFVSCAVAHAQSAAPKRWVLTRADVAVISVPPAIRNQLGDLEYDDTSSVQGVMVDLNGDGTKDYIIKSAQSLCGNGGCDYAIVDGATGKSLGMVFGGTLVVGGAAAHSFPAIETVSHLSAESVTDATYSFDGSCYVESSTRVVSGASLDSLESRLARLPRFRP